MANKYLIKWNVEESVENDLKVRKKLHVIKNFDDEQLNNFIKDKSDVDIKLIQAGLINKSPLSHNLVEQYAKDNGSYVNRDRYLAIHAFIRWHNGKIINNKKEKS